MSERTEPASPAVGGGTRLRGECSEPSRSEAGGARERSTIGPVGRRGVRARERGSMLPILAGAMLLLAMLGIGALTVLRVVLARQETQRVADSACLALATIVKNEGLPLDGPKTDKALAIAGGNHPGMKFLVTIQPPVETPTEVSLVCQASIDVSAPMMIWSSGKVNVSASATGSVKQITLTQAEKKYPKLVIVLDYSGSMMATLWNGSKTSIQALDDAVNALIDRNYDIKYGLVLFATSVFDKVQLALGSLGQVKTDVNKTWHCPQAQDDQCYTDSWDALDAAHAMLGPWDNDEQRYVLFISDGQPNIESEGIGVDQGIANAQKSAQALWDDAHATIIPLQLINMDPNSPAEKDLMDFMHHIAGSPDCHPDPSLYFNANSEDSLSGLLTAIGNAIACPLQLAQPPPAKTVVHVFLKDPGGVEEALGDASRIPLCTSGRPPRCDGSVPGTTATLPGDLSDQNSCTYYQGDYYLYYAPKQSIFVTPKVCDKIMNDGDTVVVRYARPQLTQ
jgi:hypothetical protein